LCMYLLYDIIYYIYYILYTHHKRERECVVIMRTNRTYAFSANVAASGSLAHL